MHVIFTRKGFGDDTQRWNAYETGDLVEGWKSSEELATMAHALTFSATPALSRPSGLSGEY